MASVATLKDYPPSQTPGSFNLDSIRKRLTEGTTAEH